MLALGIILPYALNFDIILELQIGFCIFDTCFHGTALKLVHNQGKHAPRLIFGTNSYKI